MYDIYAWILVCFRIYLKREKFIELANSDPDTKVSSSDPVILVTFSAPDLMGSQKQWVFQAR